MGLSSEEAAQPSMLGSLSVKARNIYMSSVFNSLAAGGGALTVRPGT